MSTLDLPLRTIRVYGTLAKELKCREFKAAVRSPIDAINFLLVNFPGIKYYIKPRAFQIIVGNTAIAEHQLSTPLEATIEIRIIPAICGAGGSVGSILLGTALIAASIIFPFTAPYLLPLAIGLVHTGVAYLLIPVVTDDPQRDDPAKSYSFNGVQQTSRDGVSVPVVYGDIITGSVVISAGFEEFDDEINIDYSEEAAGDTPGSTGPKFTSPPFNPNDPVSECSYDEPDPVIVVDNPYGQSRVRVWYGEEQFSSYRERCACDSSGYIAGERIIYLRKEQSSTSMRGVETFTKGLLTTRYLCSTQEFYCSTDECGGLDPDVYNLEIAWIRPDGTKLIVQSNTRNEGDYCGTSLLISYRGTSNNHTYNWIGAIEAENPETGEWTVLYANPSPLLPGYPQFVEGDIYNETIIVDVSGDWSNAPVPFPNV